MARSKFEHSKRWGCNRKQRNLKRRWEIYQEVVGRRHTDDVSRERMNKTDEIMDGCAKRLEECEECEHRLNQADLWMGKWNKVSRLMVDWMLTKDRCRERWKKDHGTRDFRRNAEDGEVMKRRRKSLRS